MRTGFCFWFTRKDTPPPGYANPSEGGGIARDAVAGRAAVRSLWVAAGRRRERVRRGVSIGVCGARGDSGGDCRGSERKGKRRLDAAGDRMRAGTGTPRKTRVGKGAVSGERCRQRGCFHRVRVVRGSRERVDVDASRRDRRARPRFGVATSSSSSSTSSSPPSFRAHAPSSAPRRHARRATG